MPDVGQVRIAAYQVMREHGLARVTVAAVRDRLKQLGVRPGSNRELAQMVRNWKIEQAAISKMPSSILEILEEAGRKIWEIAFATAVQLQLQEGGAGQPPREASRKKKDAKFVLSRLTTLQRAVERMLATANAPLKASEIFLKLTDPQAEMTNQDHIGRDLLQITKQSKVLYRLPGKHGKWWRKDRPLPGQYKSGGQLRRYIPRNTELSLTRAGNQETLDAAVAVLSRKGEMTSDELAVELNIVELDQRKRFRELLRNHLRAKRPLITRKQGKYAVDRWHLKPVK